MFHVRDTERNVARSYVLGELATVFAKDVIVGSDPSCDVIFDDPSVPAFAAEFSGKGHHMYARSLPDGEPDRSGRAVPVGPFAVGIAFTSTPHDHAASTPNLRLRFGPRCRLATVPVSEIPVDPRAIEVARLAAALADPTHHVRELDAATERWCEEEVRAYFAALSWVTTPLPPLALRRIEYASSRAGAIDRWTRAWQVVEARSFDHAVWAQIHRFDRWRGQFREVRRDAYNDADSFATRLNRLLTDGTAERNRIAWPMYTILCTHVATRDDDASPVHPLAGLVTRRVFPFALPDNAVLLVLDACEEAVLHSSDIRDNQFLHVLARSPEDLATRMVYADYLEQRGETARADAVRDRELGPPRMSQPASMFLEAASVLIYRDEDDTPIRDVAAQPLRAHLEIRDRVYPLGAATAITYDDHKLAIGPRKDPDRGVHLVQADGAIWLSSHDAPEQPHRG